MYIYWDEPNIYVHILTPSSEEPKKKKENKTRKKQEKDMFMDVSFYAREQWQIQI